MPSWNHRGAATRGVVRKKYRIDSGCAGMGSTLPENSRRYSRSERAAWSSVDDVHQLVVHDQVHAVVAGDRFERRAHRREADREVVARHRAGGGAAAVLEVRQQHGDALGGREVEQPLLKCQRVEERAGGVGHDEASSGT